MALIQNINVSTPNDHLGDTLRDSQVKANANFSELNTKKVEVIAGKDLSTNDYTDTDKTKLTGIQAGAEVNVQANWNQTDPDADDFILNKPAITDNTIYIFDGIIGVTVGFSVGQVAFVLPTPVSVAKRVYLNGALQYKTTANNASLIGRWSQSGNIVTITKTTVLNNYIYIEYQ